MNECSEIEAREVGRGTPPREAIVEGSHGDARFELPAPDVFFRNANLVRIEFTGLHFWRFNAEESRFEGCDFEGVKVEHGPLGIRPRVVFSDCSFKAADLRFVDPGYARFERCSFEDTKIERWLAFCAEFIECRFATRLVKCQFAGKPFNCEAIDRDENDFHGNDFRDAELIDTSFILGVDLDSQFLPIAPRYIRLDRAGERIAIARRVVDGWADTDAQREGVAILDALAYDAREQQNLFTDRESIGGPQHVRDAIWALLEDAL